jgi:hypothetical protein
MPVIEEVYQATDDKMFSLTNGGAIFAGGSIYLQYGPATSYTNSITETSLFTGITTGMVNGQSSTTTANFGTNYPEDASSLQIPGSILGTAQSGAGCPPGTYFRYRMLGTIATTGTPTLLWRPGLVNVTSAAFTAINTTTALTLPAITGTNDFVLEVDFMVLSIGTSGTYGCRITLTLGTNNTTYVTNSYAVPWVVTTIDTTQSYTFDVRSTWGSASSSNILINKAGYLQIAG